MGGRRERSKETRRSSILGTWRDRFEILQFPIADCRIALPSASTDVSFSNYSNMINYSAPDLTQHPPRSVRVRLGGYTHLPRLLDKARAVVHGKNGPYHYNCPL